MEVILKEDVADLGFRGEVVKVADGYARNYLLPRKLAMQATAANKAVIEQMKSAAARRSASEKAQAETVLAELEPLVLSFTRKSGEGGHLFGSVTSSDIAAELAAQGHEVDRRKIVPADAGFRLCLVVVAQQFVRRCRWHDAPRWQGVPRGSDRGELPTRVDVAVVDVEERRWDSRTRHRIPFRVVPDGTVGRLLAACRRRQCVLGRRAAQRVLVGNKVVG